MEDFSCICGRGCFECSSVRPLIENRIRYCYFFRYEYFNVALIAPRAVLCLVQQEESLFTRELTMEEADLFVIICR